MCKASCCDVEQELGKYIVQCSTIVTMTLKPIPVWEGIIPKLTSNVLVYILF